MNVSHRYKLVWLASSRCASRFTAQLLSPLQFYNYDDGIITKIKPYYDLIYEDSRPDLEFTSFSHKIIVPDFLDLSDYEVIANIRNPYDVLYSDYRLEHMEYLSDTLQRRPSETEITISFQDWARIQIEYYYRNIEVLGSDLDYYRLKNGKNISHLIRYEHLIDDIVKIPHLRGLYETNEIYRELLDSSIFDSNPYRADLPFINQSFKDVYTQEIADYVYERYRYQFDEFGYDKESWKK